MNNSDTVGSQRGMNRRSVLAGGATIIAGSAAAAAGLSACSKSQQQSSVASEATQPAHSEPSVVAFDGTHQAGVQTPAQSHLNLIGFNLKDSASKRSVRNLMRLWTEDSRQLCAGKAPAGSLEPELAAQPARLSITCGWASSVFEKLQVQGPSWLGEVRPYSRDALQPQWGQTDIVLQVCSDDPMEAAFAMRHLVRSGVDYAEVAWVQQGFLNAAVANGSTARTPRNLFGQVDGTVNPRSEEEFAEQVWIGEGEFKDGSAMVIRRIHMNMETWGEVDRKAREVSTGRSLVTGAPLGQEDEFDAVDLELRDNFGLRYIDPTSHVARAHPPAHHPEQKILRRPYNYDQPELGLEPGNLSNTGQIFICFQKDPRKQFEPIQARLDEVDQLNTWITHIGSAMYYVLPGTVPGGNSEQDPGYWGQRWLGE